MSSGGGDSRAFSRSVSVNSHAQRALAAERPSTALGLYSPTSSFGRQSGGSHRDEMPPGATTSECTRPWSGIALSYFKDRLRPARFQLLEAGDNPKTARLDAVFALPQSLWPVLPPGAIYVLEGGHDPRASYTYLQHSTFPDIKVRLGTYYGKWSSAQVDVVVCWQPPASDSAWQAGGAPPPSMPWETRQVVAFTTRGEYQYSRTRMRFRAAKSALRPNEEPVEWCDAHGVDHPDTKAANECAARNSDKDRDAHLIDPPKPNTWGEHARRLLVSELRHAGGGAYSHHILYDHSGVRTGCGRRVPAGYFFSLLPSTTATPLPAPGGGGGIRGPMPAAEAAAARAAAARPGSAGPGPGGMQQQQQQQRPHTSMGFRPGSAGGMYGSPTGPAVGGVRASSVLANQFGGGTTTTATSSGHNLLRPGSAVPGGAAGAARGRAPSPGPGRPASPGTNMRRAPSPGPPGWRGSPSPSPNGANKAGARGAKEPGGGGALLRSSGSSLAPMSRWRSYGVPFSHPIHRTRAAALYAAVAQGPGGPADNETAAVLRVSEEELRLPAPFMPAPVVLRHWDDIPAVYAQHMAAARALLPVSDEVASLTAQLHVLLYHLTAAASLEWDRLDAKLLLLPQMARLGRKSAEIDAWLQVTVEQASYLYEKLQVNNPERWRQQPDGEEEARAGTASLGTGPGPSADWRAAAAVVHTSTSISPSPNVSAPIPSLPFPDPLAPSPYASGAANPSPDPTALPPGAAPTPTPPKAAAAANNHTSNGNNGSRAGARSVTPSPLQQQQQQAWPALVSVDEWAGVLRIMDACRHAALYERWIRLRPFMSGTALPAAYAKLSGAGGATGDAAEGSATGGLAASTPGGAAPSPFSHGTVNGELLEYLHEDIEEMAAEDFEPLPPPLEEFPPPRGYHPAEGEEGPPAAAVTAAADKGGANSRRARAARRRRGLFESPLPAEVAATDVYHYSTKMCQVTPRLSQPDLPVPPDEGIVGVSQAAVERATLSRNYKYSREAEVRRAMRRARGLPVSDDGQGGGDDAETMSVGSAMTGMTGMTGASGLTAATGFTRADSTTSRRSGRSVHGGNRRRGAASLNAIGDLVGGIASGTACQVTPRLWSGPEPEDPEAVAARRQAAADAEANRRMIISGKDPKIAKAKAEAEARRAAEEAARTLQPVTPRAAPVPKPTDRPAATGAVWRQLADGRDIGQYGPQEQAEEAREEAGEEWGELQDAIAAAAAATGNEADDFASATAKRRAIAAARVVREAGRFMPRSEVLQLFLTFTNLRSRPDMAEALARAVCAPVSAAALAARSTATEAMARTAGAPPREAAAAAASLDPAAEAMRQRLRATAWMLGVTWRRMPTETYTTFVCRILGWAPELTAQLNRTRAAMLVARALVRGHDPASVPQPPPRI
ncbi:hypothetical protein HYH02_012390 [Chlamydomonas schloesseri]|uniref:Uncharacterized protein n=1 Tax=Chlamydomonas schloesseri TaxID=2026947 RepID=A0A835TA96_9CHLO|nr:hypothetical protein HYH02_012390 [Chlamydomonas schloesseri]|eukprot:KAG2434375.1 hypothetical protein HYH02_012390 [Chlamydomonas schloesseri]